MVARARSRVCLSQRARNGVGGGILYLVAAVQAVAPARATLAIVVALVLVSAIGLSRIVLGVHWPSDVLGGIAIGYLLQRLCALWAAWKEK